MRLDKRKIFIAENPHKLYSSMVVTLINRLYADNTFDAEEEIQLIASKMHTNKYRNEELLSIIEHNATATKFSVHTAKPYEEKGLQVVDFISWSLLRKYEMRDDAFVEIISSKIVKEYEFY